MSMAKLGDIGSFVSGGTPSRKHPEYYEGTIPWVSTPALNGGFLDESNAVQFITEDAIAKSATKLLPPRSLLIGVRVGVGKTAINAVPMCTNQDIVAITDVDEEAWDIQYLAYVVQSKSAYLVSQKQGATITGITSKLLKSLQIGQPNIGLQRSRVRHLDSVKHKLNDCAIQLLKLDELVKSRFVEILRLCDCNDCSPLEVYAKRVKVGFVGTVGKHYTDSTGIPMIRTTNITASGLDLADLKYVTEEFDAKNKKSHLRRGDVIIARHGENGRACVYEGPEAQCLNVVIIEPNPEQLLPICLEAFMNSDLVREQISRKLVGSTQQVVNTKTVASVLIPSIPTTLQQEFAAFVQHVDKLKADTQLAIDKLQLLYDSLAQEYFGEV